MDYASDDDDFDTAAELQAEISEEWDDIMVVWINGDRGDPEEVPAASVEVVARNAARRPVRTRRQPNRYSDGRNAARIAVINRRLEAEAEALIQAEAAALENRGAENNEVIELFSSDSEDGEDNEDAEDNEVIELLSSDDDDNDDGPAFPTYYDDDVAHSQLRKQISQFVGEMSSRQIAQLMGRMYRELRSNGGKTSGQKRKSAE